MKNLKKQLNRVFAALTYQVASKGAGLASDCGWYQPKVPAKLCK